jgi:hypothetical protein
MSIYRHEVTILITLMYTTEGVHSGEAIADLFAEVEGC